MDVCESRGIGDDGIGRERTTGYWIGGERRPIKPIQHGLGHLPLGAYIAVGQACPAWQQARICITSEVSIFNPLTHF